MRFGVHVRMDRGLVASLDRAELLECETVQLFSGNPNSWTQRPLDPAQARDFAAKARDLGIHPTVLHTPYLLNLASPDEVIWRKSTDAVCDAMARAELLEACCVVTHIGSHKGSGYDAGVKKIAESVKVALRSSGKAAVALELGAGPGNCIGSRFEHIRDIFEAVGDETGRIGICLDTAHLWGSGYDISSAEGVERMFAELEQFVGMGKLLVVHLNDTLMPLGSHRDRHHHIGEGLVGLEGFRAIVNWPGTQEIPGIIETPGQGVEPDMANLAALRSLRA